MSELIQGSIVLILSGGVIAWAQRLPSGSPNVPGPAFFPVLIGFLGLVLGAIILVRGVLILVRGPRKHSADENVPWSLTVYRAGPILIASILFVVGFPLVGFLLCSVAFLLFTLFWLGERRWLVLLVVPLVLSGMVYYLFNNLLQLRLSTGSLFG